MSERQINSDDVQIGEIKKEKVSLRRKIFTAEVEAITDQERWSDAFYKRDLQVHMIGQIQELVRKSGRMIIGNVRWIDPVDLGGGKVKLVLEASAINLPKWKPKKTIGK